MAAVLPVPRVQTFRPERDAMTALATEDPAVAIAMGRCLTARAVARRGETFRPMPHHDRPCGWCDYPADELQAAVIEFNNWAMFNDKLGTSGRHATRYFNHELSREAQEALIVAAQGFPPPEQPVAATPAPAPDVEAPTTTTQGGDPSWLR